MKNFSVIVIYAFDLVELHKVFSRSSGSCCCCNASNYEKENERGETVKKDLTTLIELIENGKKVLKFNFF